MERYHGVETAQAMPIPSRITDPPFHADSTVLDGVDPNPPPYGIITAARLICEYSTVDHLAVKSKAKNQSPDQVPGHMAMEMEPRCGPLYVSMISLLQSSDSPPTFNKKQYRNPLHADPSCKYTSGGQENTGP